MTTLSNILAGDADGDKLITLSDAQLVLKEALRIITCTDEDISAADVDGNGMLDLTDAQLVLKKALKIIDKFPIEEL